MSDIVERLREVRDIAPGTAKNDGVICYPSMVCHEAADEIERLQSALAVTVTAMEATYSDEAQYSDMSDAQLAELWNAALETGRSALSVKGDA